MKKNKPIFLIIAIVSMISVLCGNFFILNEFDERQPAYNDINWNRDLEVNPLPAGYISIFSDDFESGLSKWESITGLWHLTDNISHSNPYHSPTHSMWFGNESTGNYETGFTEMGNLTSVPIDLSSTTDTILEFYHWKETENGSPYDASRVYISTDNINWDMLYEHFMNITPWEKVSLDISKYDGNSSVQLRFFFDTGDYEYNDYRGWLIDDIRIYENDNAPTLSSGSVSPNPGKLSDLFTYTVNYMDIDGDAPIYVNVSINGTYYSMFKQNPFDYEYSDGCIYEYKTYLNWGAYPYNYSFGCFDGKFYTTLGPFIGPIVEWGQLFDGMYINHTFIFPILGGNGPSNVSYSYDSGHIFNTYLDTWTGPGWWDINLLTRVMSNNGGSITFGNGLHTPFWIFTNVTLNDTVLIGHGSDGDHTFNVTGELIYDLPSFGLIEVWVLNDTDSTGGNAWYEKSTGILLNGTFIPSDPTLNYTFTFNDTNVEFTNFVYPPSSPSISINSGAASTNSTLVALTPSAVGAEEMCFRNGTSGAWSSWETYATTKQLYLGGSTNNTDYTIQVKFQNSGGESSVASDSILYISPGDGDGDGDDDGDGDENGGGDPVIPGYPLELLMVSLITGIGIILIFYKKNILNSNK